MVRTGSFVLGLASSCAASGLQGRRRRTRTSPARSAASRSTPAASSSSSSVSSKARASTSSAPEDTVLRATGERQPTSVSEPIAYLLQTGTSTPSNEPSLASSVPTFKVPFPDNDGRSRVASKYPQLWFHSLLRRDLRTRTFPFESIKVMVFAASELRE